MRRRQRRYKRPIDNPEYGGYISTTCLSCDAKTVGAAITFKRDDRNAILCKKCFCECRVYVHKSDLIACPICRNVFSSTNPSRKYCGDYCRNIKNKLRKEALKIKNGKKRRLAVEDIHDFLNG